MAERVVPFVATPNTRETGTGDERYINIVYERIPNDLLKEHIVYCQKRVGYTLHASTSTSGAGRGLHGWTRTGNLYSVVGNSIFLGTSTLTSSMHTSTGKCWFVEIPQSTGNESLIISDGQDNYSITSTGTVSTIDQATHTNYPVSNLGGIFYMDGYLFQGTRNGRIYNSRINSISSWPIDGFLTADTHAGELEAVYKQRDQIIGLTKNRTEFFFNNGNPSGSPLLRIDQNTIPVGIASKQSLAWSGDTACWVSENSGDGDAGRCVYTMQALQRVKDISSPVINRFLAAEGQSISSCESWMERVNGQVLYGLNLAAANRTFVYGVDTGLWSEWQSSVGAFRAVAATSLHGRTYFQDATNGNIYVASHSSYQDSGSAITVRLQTRKYNFGTPEHKVNTTLTLVADQTVGTVSTYKSDDDYQTSTQLPDIDMNSQLKDITRLGGFYERSYTFLYSGASTFRVQGFVPGIK